MSDEQADAITCALVRLMHESADLLLDERRMTGRQMHEYRKTRERAMAALRALVGGATHYQTWNAAVQYADVVDRKRGRV